MFFAKTSNWVTFLHWGVGTQNAEIHGDKMALSMFDVPFYSLLEAKLEGLLS